jgi:amphi-Trp domain-containing protein
LLTGREEPVVEFKKGAACLLEFGGTVDVCNAVLLWAMRPAQLRRLGESSTAAGKTDRDEGNLERASSERGSPAMAQGKGCSGQPSWKEERHRQKLSRKEEKRKAKLSRKQAKQARKRASRSQQAVVGYDNRLELSKVVALIQDVLTGFQGGSVSVESADQKLTVSPSALVEFRVRARQTHKSESIMLRVRWPRTSVSEETASLRVSS